MMFLGKNMRISHCCAVWWLEGNSHQLVVAVWKIGMCKYELNLIRFFCSANFPTGVSETEVRPYCLYPSIYQHIIITIFPLKIAINGVTSKLSIIFAYPQIILFVACRTSPTQPEIHWCFSMVGKTPYPTNCGLRKPLFLLVWGSMPIKCLVITPQLEQEGISKWDSMGSWRFLRWALEWESLKSG